MTRLTLLICMLTILCSCSRKTNAQRDADVQHKQYAHKQDTAKAKQSTIDSAKIDTQQAKTATIAKASEASTAKRVDLHEFSRQVAARYAIGVCTYDDVAMNRRSMQDFITVACETNDLPTMVCMKLASDQFDKLAMRLLRVNINVYAQIIAYTCDGQQCISRYKAIVDRKLAKDLKRIQEDFEQDKAVQRKLQEESAQDD